MPARLRPSAQLVEQPGLADAGLTLDRDVGGPAVVEGVECGLQVLELAVAPDQPRWGGTGP
jgi:hypothetical protein